MPNEISIIFFCFFSNPDVIEYITLPGAYMPVVLACLQKIRQLLSFKVYFKGSIFNSFNLDFVIHTGDISLPKTLLLFDKLSADLKGVFGNNDQEEKEELEVKVAKLNSHLLKCKEDAQNVVRTMSFFAQSIQFN